MAELKIMQVVYQTILQEAADSPKREICGLLYGKMDTQDSRIGSYFKSIPNVSPNPHQFQMDPQALVEVLFRMKEKHELQLLSIVHSHPFGHSQSRPSREDLRAHWSAAIWSSIVFRDYDYDYDEWKIRTYKMEHGSFTQIPVKVLNSLLDGTR